MNKPVMNYFKDEDVLHILLAEGEERQSVDLSPTTNLRIG
jgi:hypothetical protein